MAMPQPELTYGGPGGASGEPATLTAMAQVDDLAAWLQSPHRDRTVLVLTIADRQPEPWLSAAPIAQQHRDSLEVFVMRNGGLTKRLAEHLPKSGGVFGGGARIYPPWSQWQGTPHKAPLFLARNRGEQQSLRERVPVELQRLMSQGPPGRTSAGSDRATAGGGRPASGGYSADGTVIRLEIDDDATRLAGYLTDPGRTYPVVALSVHPDAGGAPYIDADRMATELEGLAVVVVLSPDATFGLTEALGDRTLSVFFGAGRVYPVGTEWLRDMYRAPLRMCSSWDAAPKVGRTVLEDALAAANAAGLIGRTVAAPEDRAADGRIDGTMGELHALVRLAKGGQAVLLNADVFHGVPYDRLFGPRFRIAGRVRGGGLLPRFIPDPIPDDPAARARAAFPDGAVALARVAEVTAERADLQLHPAVSGTLLGDDDEDLRDLLSVDDVVAVTAWWFADGLEFALADAAAEPASLSVLPGGPAWLRVEDLEPPQPEDEEEEPEVARPETAERAEPRPQTQPADSPAIGPAAVELGQLRRQLTLAQAQIELLQGALDARGKDISRLQAQASTARRKARRAKAPATPQPVFTDPQRQLRHEIWLAWLERFDEQERDRLPLPEDYRFGEGFLDSLTALKGISQAKVVDVLVEVLTGLDQQLAGRQRHPWLQGRGGDQQVRDDGARAWRVSLQVETPGARRLKYWRLPGGTVEFDSVGHHDDGLG